MICISCQKENIEIGLLVSHDVIKYVEDSDNDLIILTNVPETFVSICFRRLEQVFVLLYTK